MQRVLYRAAIVVSILGLLIGFGLNISGAAAQGRGAAIRLRAATFAPALGQQPNIPAALTIAGYAAEERGYFIVQFAGPIEQSWKDQVAVLGGELLDYIPDYAFKVRMSPAEALRVRRLPNVVWVGLFHPAYKLSPDLRLDGQSIYTVRIERGADLARAEAALSAAGIQVLGRDADKLVIVADAALLEAAARITDVAWISNFVLAEKHNEFGGGQIIGGLVANNLGYDGSSQIAAVADTGLGGGTAATAHRDIPAERIVAVYNWPGVTDSCFSQILDDGAQDVDSGHGTHVSGSVLSAGDPNGQGRGVAPAARLVFQAVENYVVVSSICQIFLGYTNGYYLTGLPADLRQLFQQAYNAGARVHANSWGSAVAGDYNANSVETDDFVWQNRDLTITFSAGNSGIDANADGVVDNDSIGSPATSKNVITVGASENVRSDNFACDASLTYVNPSSGQSCNSQAGLNDIFTWNEAWGSDFPANPIANDLSAGNAEQMAAFSSRGPTDDGRIKPDVVAPGSWILSGYSDLYQEGYDGTVNPRNSAFQYDGWGFPTSPFYKYLGGTSMSNPLVAGGAVVVRDFYQKAYGVSASAALVKATLINSAVDMLDENNDGANDNDFPIPNNHEGWGRIDLINATDGSAQFVDNTSGLSTNGSATYTYNVSAGAALKISLVWSDAPSTETASKNLVNDLNLLVTAPNGTQYRGNVFSGGWSATGGSADTTNNVENVYLQAPVSGSWTVQVSGANIPNGPQPFALVVDANFGAPVPTATVTNTPIPPTVTNTPVPPTVTNTPVPPTVTNTPGTTLPAAPSNLTASAPANNRVNLSWRDNSNNESGFKIERCTNSNCSNFTQIATVGANVTSYTDTTVSARITYRYRVRAYNAVGNSGYSNVVQIRMPR